MLYRNGEWIGGKYEVRDVLGASGFGVVYLVYSREWRKLFALKTFRDEFLEDPTVRNQFRKEARLWIGIGEHPCIVQAHFIDEVDGRLFVASEFVEADEGGLKSLSLDKVLRVGPLDLRTAILWSLDLCWGMEFARFRGIRCHRDIKPSNVLVSRNRGAKISDFGLAGALVAKVQAPKVKVDMLDGQVGLSYQTRQGLGVGTPMYMPPEQFVDASACDERSDIYSFGVTLFQMVEGRLPFLASPPRDDSEDEGMRFMMDMFLLHCDAPIPVSRTPLSKVLRRCLQKRPEARYQGFEELRKGLLLVLNDTFSATDLPRKVQALSEAYDEAMARATARDLTVGEWNNKGTSLLVLGHPEDAIHCFNRAIELNPSDAKVWSNKGAALEEMNRSGEALECYERSVGLDPTNAKSWNCMGVCLFLMGRHEQALRCCDRAVQLDPGDGRAWFNRGTNLWKTGRTSEAVDCFRQALLLIPREPKVWKHMGSALMALDQFEEATHSFTQALAIDPQDAEAWHEKGYALACQERYEEALPCLQKALEIDAKIVLAWFQKGILEDTLGHTALAVESFRKFLLLAGDSLPTERGEAAKRVERLENQRFRSEIDR